MSSERLQRVPSGLRWQLRRLRRAINEAFTVLWAALFGLGFGPRLTPAPELGGGRRVLVLAPHPDDEVAGCAGAIALHRRAGDAVMVAWVTDGRRSRALGLGADQTADRRRLEAVEAARRLDVESRWLGFAEGEWSHRALVEKLGELFDEARPTLLYAPGRVDFHPEHLAVARALAEALGGGGSSVEQLRIYPVQVPLTPRVANRALSVEEVEEVIQQAFAAYPSQLGSLQRCWRMRRYAARQHRLGGLLVEEFFELSSERYVELHRDCAGSPTSPFRSLRYDAWSDPLAYLRGAAERHRWLAASPRPRG